MKRWLPVAVAAVCLLSACGREPPTPPEYRLDGSWFVRYASDPKPYLDVAFHGPDVPARVTATLQGPTQAWPDLTLSWNAAEEEWQIVCTFLPDPLPGGWWFVSHVTAYDSAGRATTWSSQAPGTPYADGIEPGFYYASEDGALKWRVETLSAGAKAADPILRVARADAPNRWVAANDDWDVGQPWAAVEFPVEAGVAYVVTVYGEEDDAGAYAIRARPVPGEPSSEAATPGQPGTGPSTATALPAGSLVSAELGGTPHWWRFTATQGSAEGLQRR
jgi:hypothetical protein